MTDHYTNRRRRMQAVSEKIGFDFLGHSGYIPSAFDEDCCRQSFFFPHQYRGSTHEAYVSTEQSEEEEQARVSLTHEIEDGAKSPGEPPGERTLEAYCQRGKVTLKASPCAIRCEKTKFCVATAVFPRSSRMGAC